MNNTSIRNNRGLGNMLKGLTVKRGQAWGMIIIGALIAFEMFNYSTTQFALNDVLGNLTFAGIRWATILALAFCGIDFAGIARLFTPEQGREEPAEVWYLFGAWILAAAMNAALTWWGVAVAIASHTNLSSEVDQRLHAGQGGTGLCSRDGAADPGAADRHLLDQGQQVVQPGRWAQQCPA